MVEFVRDPAWQFVGAVVALFALGVSLWVYWAQRYRKRLLIDTVARVPLVTRGAKEIDGLEIFLNGRPIADAIVWVIRIQNIGNLPIVASDFEEPVSLSFLDDAIVLSAKTGRYTPKDLRPRVGFAGNTVTLEGQLLNPGDSFTCRVLAENSRKGYERRARIAGVHRVETQRTIKSIWFPLMSVVPLLISFGALFLSPQPASRGFSLRTDEVPYFVVAGLSLIAAFVLMLKYIVAELADLRRRRGQLEDF